MGSSLVRRKLQIGNPAQARKVSPLVQRRIGSYYETRMSWFYSTILRWSSGQRSQETPDDLTWPEAQDRLEEHLVNSHSELVEATSHQLSRRQKLQEDNIPAMPPEISD
jgi:hypothetical protein